jgi:hypothetical protein
MLVGSVVVHDGVDQLACRYLPFDGIEEADELLLPVSRERLKVRMRCGWSWCARQMRCTERSEMPVAFDIARPVQWVA